MKSLMLFLQEVFHDMEDLCGTSTRLDLKEIQSRVEHEGISFLTISLPSFGKDFEKSLDQGFVARDLFQGFSWKRGLPRLFGGFLELVFAREGGRLLDEPSINAIFAIRQMTLVFSKILLDCADWRIQKAIDEYIKCEQDVRISDRNLPTAMMERFKRIGNLVWSDTFQAVEEDIFYGRITPNHGPGATAEKLSSNAKWIMTEWTQRLERYFPHWEYLLPSESGLIHSTNALDGRTGKGDPLGHVNILEPGAERPVRIVHVPKTLKTPRIIAVEPACMMFIQQGILGSFERELSRPDGPGKFIRWKHREPNQLMALQGSVTGELATLDLSEASDRVSYQHVRALLERFPHLAGGVDACRSRKADVNGKVIRLAKYASMGSALCFPFESMVFFTLILLGIEESLSRPLTRKDISSLSGKVRVYGDDLILPVEYVPTVIEVLELFGFKVNLSKSFWTGKFRESCGKEYYDGHDVSITRLRRVLPTSRQNVDEIIGTVATRNLFYKAGMWRTAAFLDRWLEKIIPLPTIGSNSSVLGRFSFLAEGDFIDYSNWKLDPHLHTPIVKGYVESSQSPRDPLDDYGALLKCLTLLSLREPGVLPDTSEHLERSGRPLARRIKLRWAPAL